ncbi:helix-loop-helix DNA-binding domain-containing protein [Dichotomocladium elegans]|nr:helix-loop-helix DNA-binding domain-containing protein [Dichotomocladium elegans]
MASSASAPGEGKKNQQRALHNSVEKRRREQINDKIHQLKEMIPSCNPYSGGQSPIAGPTLYQPLHKITILQAAITYIQDMHQRLLLDASEPRPLANSSITQPIIWDDPRIIQVLQHARRCHAPKSGPLCIYSFATLKGAWWEGGHETNGHQGTPKCIICFKNMSATVLIPGAKAHFSDKHRWAEPIYSLARNK